MHFTRNNKRKLLALLLMLCCLTSMLSPTTFAQTAETPDADDAIETAARRLQTAHEAEQEREKMEASAEISSEILEKNGKSASVCTTVKYYVNDHDDILRKHFAGAYVNDENEPVVVLSCDADCSECRRIIEEELDLQGIVFAQGNGSFYEKQIEFAAILEQLHMFEQAKTTDSAAAKLMAYSPLPQYDLFTNSITVEYLVPALTEQALRKSVSPYADAAQTLSAAEQTVLTELYSAISAFEEFLSQYEDVEVLFTSNREEFSAYAADEIRPGQGIVN